MPNTVSCSEESHASSRLSKSPDVSIGEGFSEVIISLGETCKTSHIERNYNYHAKLTVGEEKRIFIGRKIPTNIRLFRIK